MNQWKITIVVDNRNSWISPYVEELITQLRLNRHIVSYVNHHTKITEGDVAFLLACQNIVPKRYLNLNKHNLVVHESDLPKGKGWSPLTWQILEGYSIVPITLFEATERVDNGPIYFQEQMEFEGHELVDELRQKQGDATVALCLKFVEHYPNITGIEQTGSETFYPKRTPQNSEVDINKPLIELFDQLRVADNERYPVFFNHLGYKYTLKIEKA